MCRRPVAPLALVTVLVTALATLAAACGGGGRSPQAAARRTITFSISLAEEEKKPVEDLLARFERESGTRVRLVSVAAADLPQKLEVDARAGRPTIDLFAQDNLALRPLVDKGLVQDLSDAAIPPEVVASMVPERFGGKQYFLPFRPNVRLAYVNRDRFRRAGASVPRTADELRAAAVKLKASAGSGKVTFSLAEGDPAAVTVSELIVSYGGNPLVLNDPGSVASFEFLRGMWRDGLLARESLLAKYDTEVDNLTGETAWYAENWPFTSTQLAAQGVLDRFTVDPGWRGPVRSAHVVGGDVLGVPAGVQGGDRKAALDLAAFLMSADAQRALVRGNAWPSIRTDAYTAVDPKLAPTFDAIREALQSGWLRPSVPYWSDVTEQLNAAVQRILQKGEEVRPVLDELHARIEQAAERTGSPYPPA